MSKRVFLSNSHTRLTISVGEPWDFDAGDGSCKIIAFLEPALSGERLLGKRKKEYWFVVNCRTQVRFKGWCFESLLMTPRYDLPALPVRLLEEGETIICNGVWRKDGQAWDRESVAKAHDGLLEVDGFITGGIEISSEEGNGHSQT